MKRALCVAFALMLAVLDAPPSTQAARLAPQSDADAKACTTVEATPLAPRRFVFPRDEAPHAGFATEWWRTFGRLTDMNGNAYDVSVNVSRFAIGACGVPANRGAWGASHIVTSAYEILDERTSHVTRATHVERDGPLGAKSAIGRLDVAIAGLRLRASTARASRAAFDVRLRDGSDATFAIEARARRDAVPLGPSGVLQTGSCRACTAYAYAYPDAVARGSISLAGEARVVAGTMWVEHEFAHHELDGTDTGWLRFDLSLDDRSAIDVRFTCRRSNGADLVTNVSGAVVSPSGRVTYLHSHNAAVDNFPPGATWHSAASDVTYESAWTVDGFDVGGLVQDQEIYAPGRSPYYMGAADFDSDAGRKGHGFVELTGFGSPILL